MKTNVALCSLVMGCLSSPLLAQSVNIPDANFKNALLANANINTNMDSQIDVAEAAAFGGYISVSSLNISDMTGIEAFPSIIGLYCDDNQITSLNLSNFTHLIGFFCDHNQLTTLNVSGCTALESLWCHDNLLTSLDISGLPELGIFYCQDNQLTTLNASNCPKLYDINCTFNSLVSLDVSNCTNISTFNCSSQQLTSLNLTGCTLLYELDCSYNQLTSLDLTTCTNLQFFSCGHNQLTGLDLMTCSLLTDFHCRYNPDLYCIQVPDPVTATANWTETSGNIDPFMYFSSACMVGATTLDENNHIRLYPNPAEDMLFVEAETAIERVEISNIAGQVVLVMQGNVRAIDLSALSATGTYIAKVITEKETQVLPLQKL